MDEALRYMASRGFNLTALTLDGNIHRFDAKSKGSGWYVGFQNHSTKGQVYCVVKFGDWNGGEEHVYKPEKMSRADQAAVNTQILEAQKRVKDERAAKQEEAAKRAELIIGQLKPSKIVTPYMERKRIPAPQLVATDDELNRVLKVPMYDVEGRLWNIQTIAEDKKFLYGGRTKGLFHVVGVVEKEAFVCEGFATGWSIHQATQKPVIVAFNCHNLLEVVKLYANKFPEVKLTVCGDDDRFTEGNPGRKCADAAAEITLTPAKYPVFKTEGKLTDFNDLHCSEGLKAVADIFTTKEKAKGFIPLGLSGDKYVFYNRENRIVSSFSQFTKTNLYRLAPEKYWASRYGTEGKYDTNTVADFLINLSMKVGKFNVMRLRGAGVWLDDGKIVVNTGTSVYPADPESWYVYTASEKRLPQLDEPPLTIKECETLLDVCQSIKWTDPKSGPFLAGWLAVARIAGALPIRPHAWLTGGAGTGKTTVMGFIEKLLGSPNGLLNVLGSSTEAGIRQAVKDVSVPVIFDEFETTDLRSSERIRATVDLMRASWSNTGGSLLKGTADGQSIEFRANFAALVSSIRVNLDNDADKSRFTILELDKHGDDQEHFNRLKELLKLIDHTYGRRLFIRMVGQIENVIISYNLLREELAKRASQRYGQQVGMILAGYHALTSDRALTKAEATELANGFIIEEDELPENDAVELLKFILTSKITVRNSLGATDISIGDAVTLDGYDEYLRTYGLKKDKFMLYVANSHAEIAKLLQHTRWAKEWWRTLQRLPGSKKKHMKFGSSLHRCTGVLLNDPATG